MIFLLVWLCLYVPLVLGRARLQKLRSGPGHGPGHVGRNALCVLLAAMPLGFVNPAVWLCVLAGILLYQGHRFRRELAYRHRTVQFQRGNGPASEAR